MLSQQSTACEDVWQHLCRSPFTWLSCCVVKFISWVLDGKSKLEDSTSDEKIVKIVNISLSGTCFEIHDRHDIQVGQKGTVKFTLGDRKNSVLLKNIIVRSVEGNRIGCEFIENRAYEKDLGFYLRF